MGTCWERKSLHPYGVPISKKETVNLLVQDIKPNRSRYRPKRKKNGNHLCFSNPTQFQKSTRIAQKQHLELTRRNDRKKEVRKKKRVFRCSDFARVWIRRGKKHCGT